MATQLESDTDANVGELVAGIMQDARQLFVQQMTLFEVEVKNDVHRITAALVPLTLGAGILLAAVVALTLACAHLVVWLDPDIPLWVALALLGAVVALAGALLIYKGKSKLDEITLPEKSLAGLKENIQWTRKN